MAIVTMTDAIAGTVALAAEYNKVTANVRDLDSRVQFLELASGSGSIGGEYRGTGQVMATGANKLTVATVVNAAAGITWNGTNMFTTLSAGVYAMYAGANMSFVSTASWALAINDGTSYAATPYQNYASPLFAAGQTNAFTSGLKYLAAGATISCYGYNNEGTSRTLIGAEFRVWRVA